MTSPRLLNLITALEDEYVSKYAPLDDNGSEAWLHSALSRVALAVLADMQKWVHKKSLTEGGLRVPDIHAYINTTLTALDRLGQRLKP